MAKPALPGGDLTLLGEGPRPVMGADMGLGDKGIGAGSALTLPDAALAMGVRLRLGYEGDGGCADTDDDGVCGVAEVGAISANGGVPLLGLLGSLKADGGAGERCRVGGGGAERVGGGGAGGSCWIGGDSFSSGSDGG